MLADWSIRSDGFCSHVVEHFFCVYWPSRDHSRHRYLYDLELLRDAMAAAGFVDVRRCGFRTEAVSDLDRLDNRPEDKLCVEGRKAAA